MSYKPEKTASYSNSGLIKIGSSLTVTNGTVDIPNNVPLAQYSETNINLGTKSTSFTINLNDGIIQIVTISSSCTISFTGFTAGKTSSVILSVLSGGSLITWDTPVKWAGGSIPILSTSGIDRLVFTSDDGGTTIYGFVAGLDFK